jgi:hypothetical protein
MRGKTLAGIIATQGIVVGVVSMAQEPPEPSLLPQPADIIPPTVPAP